MESTRLFRLISAAAALLLGAACAQPKAAAGLCDHPHERAIEVGNASALETALADASPGTMIRLRDATYSSRFTLARSGTADQPIVLCGSRAAVLDGGSTSSSEPALHLRDVQHWILSGFTVRGGRNGLLAEGASHNRVTGLAVKNVGAQAIVLRRNSSDNELSSNEIGHTGLAEPGAGEGVYVGTDFRAWDELMGASDTPDRSDGNRIRNNVFGAGITAENVELREGTSQGLVSGNTFDGTGLSGADSADSWVDVRGNGYRISDNTGHDALADGFQTHAPLSGWGEDNVFALNLARVNGPGYGFAIDTGGSGNLANCDNTVENAGKGFANVPCAGATPPDGEPLPPPVIDPPASASSLSVDTKASEAQFKSRALDLLEVLRTSREAPLQQLHAAADSAPRRISIRPITDDRATWHRDGDRTRSHTEPGIAGEGGIGEPIDAIIYLNPEAVDPSKSRYPSGILVHEIVHALDFANGRYHPDYTIRERRAVAMQNGWRDAHDYTLRADYHDRFETVDYQRALRYGTLSTLMQYIFNRPDLPPLPG